MRTCVCAYVSMCIRVSKDPASQSAYSCDLSFLSQSPIYSLCQSPTFSQSITHSVSHTLVHRCLSPFHSFFISVHTSMRYSLLFIVHIFLSYLSIHYCPPSSCLLFTIIHILSVLSFREKIPPHCQRQRNCQLTVVVLSVVITLATSAANFVDW